MAAVAGALPQLLVPAPVRWVLFGLLALPVLARECGLVRFAVCQNARLVPEDVQHLREWGALQFGFEMGTGMRTYSPCVPSIVFPRIQPPQRQCEYMPRLQKSHFPQEVMHEIRTLSPFWKAETAFPVSSTTPMPSWPRVRPSVTVGTSPFRM